MEKPNLFTEILFLAIYIGGLVAAPDEKIDIWQRLFWPINFGVYLFLLMRKHEN